MFRTRRYLIAAHGSTYGRFACALSHIGGSKSLSNLAPILRQFWPSIRDLVLSICIASPYNSAAVDDSCSQGASTRAGANSGRRQGAQRGRGPRRILSAYHRLSRPGKVYVSRSGPGGKARHSIWLRCRCHVKQTCRRSSFLSSCRHGQRRSTEASYACFRRLPVPLVSTLILQFTVHASLKIVNWQSSTFSPVHWHSFTGACSADHDTHRVATSSVLQFECPTCLDPHQLHRFEKVSLLIDVKEARSRFFTEA